MSDLVSETRTRPGVRTPGSPAASLPFLGELEGLRAVGAIAVMLTHIGFLSGATGRDVFPGLLARMDIGVAIFFVLSGFLLFRPYARTLFGGSQPPSLRRYASRRAARIMPALIAVLLGTVLLVPETRRLPGSVWWANVLQIQAWRMEWDIPGLVQLWSLSTEIAFYALLPLIGWIICRLGNPAKPWTVLALAGALFAIPWLTRSAYHAGLLAEGLTWTRTLPLNLDWFGYGIVLALIVEGAARFPLLHGLARRVSGPALILAASIFWILTTWLGGPYDLAPAHPWQEWIKHLGYGLVAALIVMPSALGSSASPLTPLLRSRAVTFLGRISYGIFLWHLAIAFWVRHTLGLELFSGGFWVTLGATSVLTFIVATLSWYLIERPIITWVRQRTR